MTPDFSRCVEIVLHEEDSTGLGKVTYDLGGATRWGIAARYHPGVDVPNLSRAGAIVIYRSEYWDPLRCSEMPAPLGMVLFDCAVNPGQAWAKFALQAVLHIDTDGKFGPETMDAARRAGMDEVVALSDRRLSTFISSPDAKASLTGWRLRCFRILYQAARMDS